MNASQIKAARNQIKAAQIQLQNESNPVAARSLVATIATLESRLAERLAR